MERRTYLGSLGAASTVGLTGLAGCLDELSGDNDDTSGNWGDGETVLDPPDRPGDPDAFSHPVHGYEFPSFSLPDPLADETVSLDDLVGEGAFLMTFFFTACPDGACPALLLRLRRAQEDAAERGYEDDLSLLAMTFDPERDTPDVLEEYGHEQGVDLEAGNWHFLRPESYEEGKEVLHDDIGMRIQRIEDMDELEHENGDGDGDGDDDDDATESHDEDGHDGDDDGEDDGEDHDGDDDHDHGEYSFNHINLIVLVNDQGVVERAYPQVLNSEDGPSIERIVEDTRTVAQQ